MAAIVLGFVRSVRIDGSHFEAGLDIVGRYDTSRKAFVFGSRKMRKRATRISKMKAVKEITSIFMYIANTEDEGRIQRYQWHPHTERWTSGEWVRRNSNVEAEIYAMLRSRGATNEDLAAMGLTRNMEQAA